MFRVRDVLPEIETLLNLDKGEGREYINGMLREMDSASTGFEEHIPIIDLTFGDGLEAWLGGGA